MTPQQPTTEANRHPSPPDYTPRLRLKPKATPTGYVDGAWWPWSDNLTAELPDLLAVLSVRLGPIQRVLFNLGEWAEVPKKFATGGRTVKLDGYRRQPLNTVEVVGLNRDRIALLVVPPNTEPQKAHAAMMSAAHRDDKSTVGQLLDIPVRAE